MVDIPDLVHGGIKRQVLCPRGCQNEILEVVRILGYDDEWTAKERETRLMQTQEGMTGEMVEMKNLLAKIASLGEGAISQRDYFDRTVLWKTKIDPGAYCEGGAQVVLTLWVWPQILQIFHQEEKWMLVGDARARAHLLLTETLPESKEYTSVSLIFTLPPLDSCNHDGTPKDISLALAVGSFPAKLLGCITYVCPRGVGLGLALCSEGIGPAGGRGGAGPRGGSAGPRSGSGSSGLSGLGSGLGYGQCSVGSGFSNPGRGSGRPGSGRTNVVGGRDAASAPV